MNKYLVDSDSFIQSMNKYYGFDFCPAFWDWMTHDAMRDYIFSIDRVKTEICKMDTSLSDWVATVREGFFLVDTVADTVAQYKELQKWVTTVIPSYLPAAINEFYDSADIWLIAHAKAHGFTVVTQEVSNAHLPGHSRKSNKVKIPDACAALSVKCINIHTLLKETKVRMVLGETAVGVVEEDDDGKGIDNE